MKRLLLVAGSLLVLVAVAAAAFVFLFPKDLVVTELKKQVQVATGRTLTVAGDTHMTVWPALGISVDGVTLSNPAGFAGAPFLTAKKIVFAVSALPLLHGGIEVKKLILDTPVLTLVARKNGAPNWTFPTTPPKANDTKLKSLSIEDMRITDGAVSYVDDSGAPPLGISALNAALALNSLSQPASLKGDCVYRAEKLAFDTTVTNPRALLEQGATPLNVTLDGPLKAALNGAVNTATGQVGGKLETSGASVRKLLAWLGSPLPPGAGFGAFDVKADVTALMPTVAFAHGAYKLDAIGATGDVALHFGDKGRLSATGALAIPTLDVNPYIAPPAAAAAPAQGVNTATAWDAKPMDLAGLRGADADLALTVGDLRFQKMQFTGAALKLKLAAGVMDAALSRVSLYSGAGSGRLTVDASGAMPKIRTELDVADVQALPLLTAAIGFDKIEGRGKLKWILTGAGRSQADIMHNLSGGANFTFNDGAWRGVNLAQVARTVQTVLTGASTASAKTDFAEFAADFTIANGTAGTDNLRLLNPFVRLDGKGAIDIGGQTIDMHIAPRAVRSIEGQGGDAAAKGIGVPFRVSGPWSKPGFAPDLSGFAQSQITKALGGRTAGEALGDLLSGRKKDGTTNANPLEGLFSRKK